MLLLFKTDYYRLHRLIRLGPSIPSATSVSDFSGMSTLVPSQITRCTRPWSYTRSRTPLQVTWSRETFDLRMIPKDGSDLRQGYNSMADHALTFCHRTMSHTDAKNLAGLLQQCGSTISLAPATLLQSVRYLSPLSERLYLCLQVSSSRLISTPSGTPAPTVIGFGR